MFNFYYYKQITLIVVLSIFLPFQVIASNSLDQVVAIVNNEVITKLELNKYTEILTSNIDTENMQLPSKDILNKQILTKMILDKIQLQLANATGITTDDQEINASIQEIAEDEKLTLTEFKRNLEKKGIDFSDFRKYIKNELTFATLRQRELAHDLTVSSADIDSFLNSPIGQDQSGAEYRLGHILLSIPDAATPQTITSIQKQAKQIITELKNDGDFAKIAMAKSAGQQALKGGDLGWRRISAIPTIFVEYVPSMKLNEIFGPIRSSSGFHIIKLNGKRIGDKKAYTEIHVRHILLKTGHISDQKIKDKLDHIRSQIIKGADFAKTAKQKSEETSTAEKGGDLGWINKKSVLPEFYSKIINLPLGEISEPFKTQLGWHLVQVLEKRSHETSSIAARNKAAAILKERKFQEKLEAWLKKIRNDAHVEICE